MRSFEFPGKTCFLTGAASGIGEALALDLAARGCALALVDRDEPGLKRVADAARQRGATDVTTYLVDLSDGGDRLDLAEQVLAHHRRVDLVINNAGVALGGALHQVTLADFDWLISVNFGAVVRVTKAFLPHLRENPGAHLVNLSSLFGLIAPPGQVAYAASKYAVRGFTEALRHELAPVGVGVTVVHPGGIRTNIAVNARISTGQVSEEEIKQGRDRMNASLTMPPAQAARQILDAVARRRPRLVITRLAKVADVIARLTPGHYWTIMAKLSARRR
ncbi:MAG TPA: SDR family NAD(P)-dependent oxidoreductase [Pseudonocardiaceae bacterium]|jgi:short-subunit dehydrogenase|nr:SDR family NAD(P)-dependent oxidoreductase [Pseudonocardiaceae bacterium]